MIDGESPAVRARRLGGLAWRLDVALHHRYPSPRRLRAVGVLIVVATPLSWALLIWAGWSLIFVPGIDAVVNADGVSADAVERLYFTAETVFTLGYGDLVPGTEDRGIWRG